MRFPPVVRLLAGLPLPAALFVLIGAAPVQAEHCSFALGFASLTRMVPQVGSCLDNETHNPENGDGLQHTTGGLLAWRKADNWTAFTDGYRTWINGPDGLQQRLNAQRFPWEFDDRGTPSAGESAPSDLVSIPASAPSLLKDFLPPFYSTPDGRFGGVQVSDVGVPVALDLGLNWTRELYLWDILPRYEPGLFNSISTDQNLAPGLQEVGLVQFFAPYSNQGSGKRVPSRGLDLPWSHPENRFGQFANGLAAAKRVKIDTWLLYNEEDICDATQPGFSWDSPRRVQDYYDYLKTGYQAIKAANPAANVLFGSLGIVDASCQTDGTEMSFWNQWLEIAATDPAAAPNNYWFDGLSLNIHKEPEKIYDLIRRYHESMQAQGFDKPVWLMETGIPVAAQPVSPSSNWDLAVDKGNQQSFLIQAYANALAAGADHVGIYKMSDFPPGDPAYKTIKAAVKYMSHAARATKSPDNRSTPASKYVNRLNGVVTSP